MFSRVSTLSHASALCFPEILLSKKISAVALETDVLSGLTVALALVPEAIAFALIAHVSPLTGLYAAFFIA